MQRLTESGWTAEITPIERAARVNLGPALGRAVLPRAVEVLEREANRVGDAMAARAHRIASMHRQALAHGLETRIRVLDLREIDVRGRPRYVLAQQQLTQCLAAQCGRTAPRVRMSGEKG